MFRKVRVIITNDFYLFADLHTGYWPQYRKELGVLVSLLPNMFIIFASDDSKLWESLMTWRSTLKSKARELVPRFYSLGGDQPPEVNKVNAEALIRGSFFTRNGVDDEVCRIVHLITI